MRAQTDALSPEVAKYLLSIGLGESDRQQMRHLAERSESGTLTDEEQMEFDSYLHVGNLLAVLQSKARVALRREPPCRAELATQELVRQVWQRAEGRCEYCRLPVAAYPLPFHVNHIVAQQHGDAASLENLALACLHCNRHKGPNIAGRDPVSGEIVRLFHSQQDPWTEHFAWSGAELRARTVIGRITIQVLAINDPDFLAVREALLAETGLSPAIVAHAHLAVTQAATQRNSGR